MKTCIDKALTAEHVRFASNSQLAEIFDVDQNVSQRWISSDTEPSVRVLRRGSVYGVSVAVALEGIQLRREDWKHRQVHKEAVSRVLLSVQEAIAS